MTIKNTDSSELTFSCQVIKKAMEVYGTTWDIEVKAALLVGIATKANPGLINYVLDEINPVPHSLVTEADVLKDFRLGVPSSAWDSFKHKDQTRVYRH